ncbi:DUF2812 domain-containing protein [Sporosarcina sp. FSL K6-1522]|uniref:DUF2812 domain-containing protein n=1 Tax=Sporosarcina sp. FSL K6-1522 TaxID=2921554 RepID=UPI00315A4448
MAKTKYMMSKGLAFEEAKDMQKLRKKSLAGWHLKRWRFMGYGLEQGEKEDVIYSIDYRDLTPGEEAEYFELFAVSGWEHVCSDYGTHIFKAKPGTKPIYSDPESSIDKLTRQGKSVFLATRICLPITVILGLITQFTSGGVQTVLSWVFIASLFITIPAIMTSLAVLYHKWKARKLV